MKNHLGEKEYMTYSAWRAACKKANPAVTFEGNKEICNALPNVGEWGGDKGTIYRTPQFKIGDKVKPKDAHAAKETGAHGTIASVWFDDTPNFMIYMYGINCNDGDELEDVPENALVLQ